MKNLLILVAMILTFGMTNAQKIFSVSNQAYADVKVFVVDNQAYADLLVYKVSNQAYAGKNDGKWFFVNNQAYAKKKATGQCSPMQRVSGMGRSPLNTSTSTNIKHTKQTPTTIINLFI